MSPEQAASHPVDHRSDQFSFGVVLYELLCGQRPFEGTSVAILISAILRDTPSPPRSLRPDVPKELERIIERCLEKDPDERYKSADEIREALRLVERRAAEPDRIFTRKPVVIALLVVAVAGASWMWLRGSRARRARQEALPEITRFTEAGDLYEAYRLALEAEKYIPEDAMLQQMVQRITIPLPIVTKPEGADVYIKGYGSLTTASAQGPTTGPSSRRSTPGSRRACSSPEVSVVGPGDPRSIWSTSLPDPVCPHS